MDYNQMVPHTLVRRRPDLFGHESDTAPSLTEQLGLSQPENVEPLMVPVAIEPDSVSPRREHGSLSRPDTPISTHEEPRMPPEQEQQTAHGRFADNQPCCALEVAPGASAPQACNPAE